jgi:hypothetical protein
LYCIGALGAPLPLAGIAYGPTVGNVDPNAVPERLRERGYVVVDGPYPNWIYDGPIEGMDKSQLQEARKDPENWTGGEGRVKIGDDSPATSHTLAITFAAVCWCAFLML